MALPLPQVRRTHHPTLLAACCYSQHVETSQRGDLESAMPVESVILKDALRVSRWSTIINEERKGP